MASCVARTRSTLTLTNGPAAVASTISPPRGSSAAMRAASAGGAPPPASLSNGNAGTAKSPSARLGGVSIFTSSGRAPTTAATAAAISAAHGLAWVGGAEGAEGAMARGI